MGLVSLDNSKDGDTGEEISKDMEINSKSWVTFDSYCMGSEIITGNKIQEEILELVNSSLEGYFQRFRNLLGPGNRRHIQALMILTLAFMQALCDKDNATLVDSSVNEELNATKSGPDCSLRINEFVFSLDIDNINLVKLLQYIKDSNMIHKVSGYGDKSLSLQNNTTSILSSFRALAGMLLSLTNGDSDGRIILSRKKPTDSGQHGGYIKYVMLTGEKIFHEQSESLEGTCASIKGYDFNNGINYSELLKSLVSTGFQASNLGDAIDTVNQMAEIEDVCRLRPSNKKAYKRNVVCKSSTIRNIQ
ncbi:RAD3-like DNA-binding helicase protein [Artemisia annua]|uniref:RAD3-like DNA-binding helicase protein n=1 Tax=Artemisia annua TaxID=35608 RepID=A0A2U1M7Y8_ARTAN|nr:RAD3-like DNA-binding helicase protein [Artemisia annua]